MDNMFLCQQWIDGILINSILFAPVKLTGTLVHAC